MYKFLTKVFSLTACFFLKKTKLIRSFSQEGEDLIIQRILKENNIKFRDLFYLDIGAGHPVKYSNTFYFYINGSKGISIDAFEKNINLHKFFRPKDITLNLLVGGNSESVNYYMFKEPELNTTSLNRVKLLKNKKINYYKVKKIRQETISTIFQRFTKKEIEKINFFNIDIEGAESNIIKQINWKIFQPKIICVEIISKNFKEIYKDKTYQILEENGYVLYSKLINSVIFLKS